MGLSPKNREHLIDELTRHCTKDRESAERLVVAGETLVDAGVALGENSRKLGRSIVGVLQELVRKPPQ